MRILTILLLPLLFFATSCDSGGEGTACSVNPIGYWEFATDHDDNDATEEQLLDGAQFDLAFSNGCDCSAGDCNELFGGSILDEVSCGNLGILDGNINYDRVDCDPGCTQGSGRTLEDCYTYESYSCSEDKISSEYSMWVIDGNELSTARDQSLSELQMSIQSFLPSWELPDGIEDSGGCVVTSTITVVRTFP